MRYHLVAALLLLSGCAAVGGADGASPEQTVRAAFDRLYANDPTGALELFHVPRPDSREDITADLTKIAERVSSGGRGDQILGSKILGDFAVVVVREIEGGEGPVDLDPIFLRRTPNGWKVSPDFTLFTSLVGPEGEGRRELDELQQWFESRKEVLTKELSR